MSNNSPSPSQDPSQDSLGWLADPLNVGTVLKTLVALGVVLSTWLWYPFVSTLNRRWTIYWQARALSNKRMKRYLLPTNLVERGGEIAAFRKALKSESFETVMLYGSRGSGKTTVVRKALQHNKGVIETKLPGQTAEAATEELRLWWNQTLCGNDGTPIDVDYAEDVCDRIRAISTPLIMVVSVEAHAKPETLRSLLHFCKSRSYDDKLVRFIVDVSNARVVLDMSTDLEALRVKKVYVGSFTESQATSYLQQQLPKSWAYPQKQIVAREITDRLGCRALHLHNMCDQLNGGMTLEQALSCVEQEHALKKSKAVNRLKAFDTSLATALRKIDKNLAAPNMMDQQGGLDVNAVNTIKGHLTFLGFVSLVERLGSPYIFEIDAFTEEVSLEGKVMEEAFTEHYRRRVPPQGQLPNNP